MKQTLYDILGVAQDSSFEDIEIAYARRFKELRAETSWDSNRLVMLNEAREVLSDVGRRAAYDSSLAVVPARARAHSHEAEAEDATNSSAKWLIFLVVLALLAIWLVMRDGDAPGPSPAVQDGGAPVTSDVPDQSDSMDDETSIEVELPAAGGQEDTADEAVAPADTTVTAEAVEDGGFETATAEESPAAPAPDPIVGNWECFDPVTGRTSTYAFADDGTLALRESGSQTQTYAYEVAGGQIRLLNVDPPSALGIIELSANKLILNGSTRGRRIVCSR